MKSFKYGLLVVALLTVGLTSCTETFRNLRNQADESQRGPMEEEKAGSGPAEALSSESDGMGGEADGD